MDEEVRRITDECYAEARRLLRENRNRLDAIVAELLAYESLDESEIYAAAGIERPAATPSRPAPPIAPRIGRATGGVRRPDPVLVVPIVDAGSVAVTTENEAAG